jgi:hypothetical protein
MSTSAMSFVQKPQLQQGQNGDTQIDYRHLTQQQRSNEAPTRPSMGGTSVSSGSTAEAANGSNTQHRSVVRAACTNCRQAKRRCDGNTPVCGPCQNRGIDAGQCIFVSSKRGGPRYKGVKGADAAKVKADKDKAKEIAKGPKGRKSDQTTTGYNNMTSDAGSTASQQSASPPGHGIADSRTINHNNGWRPGSTSSSNHSVSGTTTNQSATSYSSYPISSNEIQGLHTFQLSYPTSQQQQQGASQSYPYNGNHQQSQRIPTQFSPPQAQFPLSNEPSPPINDPFGTMNGGPLSFANLELWQKIQEGATNEDLAAFTDFYSRLETLPKVGAPLDASLMIDPLEVLMDWEGGETGNNLQDNEQGARNLLTGFYEMVYPSCPVLLPPGNLSSLAFYFSGKGPCGLFAAISSLVSLHLTQQEAVKTLKNSQAALARLEGCPIGNIPMDKSMPPEEVAAYHARTSELILHQYSEAKSTCYNDNSCPNPFVGLDEELITIEAACAHTLLCHYYYGSGKPLSHQRAYRHAVDAWDLVQNLDLRTKAHHQEVDPVETHHPDPTRPFSADLKLEWGKRVYWASYAAATVMSCTGGFQPFGNSKDEVMDLKFRPHLEHDVAAWSIMVRGAQQVSRTYRLLYDLDQFRAKLAASGNNLTQDQLHQAAMERQTIFNAMLKLDSEIGTYTRFDPSWRNGTNGTEEAVHRGRVGYVESVEKQLAKSLKLAGRLMTSGALIILHRAQAFSNARVFMQPQCGMPEAIRLHKPVQHDVILHRAALDEVVVGQGNHDASSPSHPFLTDRFAGGPFEPTHSLERCRFAASAMISILPTLLYDQHLPKLPPYSACSFVLGAYATLMLTLLIQVHAEESGQNDSSNVGLMYHPSSSKVEEVKKQLAMHRAPVKDIILVLNRFATIWPKAVEYREEVSTLLAANETIG